MTRAEAERLVTSSEVHTRLGLELVDWSVEQVGLRFRPAAVAGGVMVCVAGRPGELGITLAGIFGK